MADSELRPRLADLEELTDFETADDAFVPAAQVYRKAPPSIATGGHSKTLSGPPPIKATEVSQHNEGDRFELDLDMPADRVPLTTPTSAGLLGNIRENKRSEADTPFRPLQGTGFPVAQRRPQATSKPKESRFKASLRSKIAGAQETAQETQIKEPSKVPVDALHSEIDAENNQKLEEMTEEEILEAQQELMAMLGGDMVDFLKGRKVMMPDERPEHNEAHESGCPAEVSPTETASSRASRDSELSAHLGRSVRFNEKVSYSNPPSRSPSPKPARRAIPLPAPAGSATVSDQDKVKEEKVFDYDPESIRQKYFPDEPLSARLDWMKDGSRESAMEKSDNKPQIYFDLSGGSHLSGPDYHSSSSHRHAGSGDRMTLSEILQLSKSAVMGQRVLAFQVLLKAFAMHASAGNDVTEELVSSDNVTAIIESCARGLADRSIGVVTAALALMEQYAILERTRLNTAAAVLTVKPAPLESFSYLLSENQELPHLSALSCLNILLALLDTREDFVSAEIVEAPFLLENIGRTFLQVPWPPTSKSVLPEPRACALFGTIISMSRSNAETLITRRVEQSVLRYVAVQPWNLDTPELQERGFLLATNALDVFTAYARYGLGCSTCNTSASLFRDIEDFVSEKPLENINFTRSWLDLLEAWCFCAIDPHSTTPEHDILWAETKEWGGHLLSLLLAIGEKSTPISIMRRLIAAMSAWLEGALKNDRPAYDEMVEKLRGQAKPVLADLVNIAAEEPVTEEKAKTLLVVKSFVGLAKLDLGDGARILSRIEVEPVADKMESMTADPEADDEGWIQ